MTNVQLYVVIHVCVYSCCVVVKNIERCLYFLPREKVIVVSFLIQEVLGESSAGLHMTFSPPYVYYRAYKNRNHSPLPLYLLPDSLPDMQSRTLQS